MESVLREKSYSFALRIVRLCQYLTNEHREFVLSKQVLRSGTSIGASVSEAEFAQSKKDFVSKLSIALKEAGETRYWLKLLQGGAYLTEAMYESMKADTEELIKLLVTSINTTKSNKQTEL